MEITVVGIVTVVIVISHCSARAYICMPVCNNDILACIGLLVVNIKAR
jgi:hypothetical protein